MDPSIGGWRKIRDTYTLKIAWQHARIENDDALTPPTDFKMQRTPTYIITLSTKPISYMYDSYLCKITDTPLEDEHLRDDHKCNGALLLAESDHDKVARCA
jgi:hypothetical protein